jgi:putative peptide zinc metalloprotease protein
MNDLGSKELERRTGPSRADVDGQALTVSSPPSVADPRSMWPTPSITLRRDLVVSRQETPEGVLIVLKDPESGRFFRLRELDYFVAQRLDGSRSLDVVAQEVEARFGARPAAAVLEQFAHRLRRLGLLREGTTEEPRTPGRSTKLRGDLLYLRLTAFDPDRLLNRLTPKVHFCFTKIFLLASAALITTGVVIALANWDDMGRDLAGLYRVETMLLAWLTIFAVTAAHEFAHAIACKHFGGEVREIGLLLIYFQLAFYCNVSDAWLFPQKAKRLWVTFAGPYFELVLWAVAVITWRVTEPTTLLNAMALIVVVTSGIKLFFNLMPLIKLDGYYLLSDYLEIPNLRTRAFGYLRDRVRRLCTAVPDEPRGVAPRERVIYVTYGILAGAYSLLLLGYIAFMVGGFLVERYQGPGAVAYAGLLLAAFRRPLSTAFRKAPALVDRHHFRMSSYKRPAIMLGFLIIVLAALIAGRMELKVAGEFKVLPIHNADVRAAVDGIIAEIYVNEGDVVGRGARIARLSDRDARAQLRKTEAEITEKLAKLRLLQAGPRREEIALMQEAVATAQTRLEHARKRYAEAQRVHAEQVARLEVTVAKAQERLDYARRFLDMFKDLRTRDLVASKQVMEAEENVAVRAKELHESRAELQIALADDLAEPRKALAVAEKEAQEAEARLTLLLAGSRGEDIEAAEAEIARLRAQRSHLLEQLELLSVMSPNSGVITTPKPREKIGQHVKKGDLIVEVHEVKTITAEIAVSEKEIGDVKVGQPVVLKARAFPELTFTGIVTSIAPAALKDEQAGREKIIRVMTETDNRELLLKPEMTGNAKVSCGSRRLIDLLTRRLARYIRVEFWSWW